MKGHAGPSLLALILLPVWFVVVVTFWTGHQIEWAMGVLLTAAFLQAFADVLAEVMR